LDPKKVKRQLIIGCITTGATIILASIQAIFAPYIFIRAMSVLVIIVNSAALGAFIREMFIIKEKKMKSSE